MEENTFFSLEQAIDESLIIWTALYLNPHFTNKWEVYFIDQIEMDSILESLNIKIDLSHLRRELYNDRTYCPFCKYDSQFPKVDDIYIVGSIKRINNYIINRARYLTV